jgi:hypothetical protein
VPRRSPQPRKFIETGTAAVSGHKIVLMDDKNSQTVIGKGRLGHQSWILALSFTPGFNRVKSSTVDLLATVSTVLLWTI